MPVDYSKWDALELSDDSDIEVHPNVDKKSFIRAKQQQIHMEREQRRMQIESYKYSRLVNDGMLKRIDNLVAILRDQRDSGKSPDEVIMKALLDCTSSSDDTPPPPPEGMYKDVKDNQRYSQMLSALADQVKKEVDERKPQNLYEAYITSIEGHKTKVENLQEESAKKLDELYQQEKDKITSENLHTGFDSSHVSKSKPAELPSNNDKSTSNTTSEVELLNPGASSSANQTAENQSDPNDLKVTDMGREFSKISMKNYGALMNFILTHRVILTEQKTDELLLLAFDAQIEGDEEYARQCVHNGLLLQYCRSLGPDGTSLFFKRVTTQGHRAQTLFRDDVNDTYDKIKSRARHLPGPNDVEQIQLQSMDPNTKINISIPPEDSTDPSDAASREIFASFQPDLQEALKTKNLDEVNKVLGLMKVADAEEVVTKLGEANILVIEEGIVDATTDEGKQFLHELENAQQEAKGDELGEPSDLPLEESSTSPAAPAEDPAAAESEKKAVDELD